jgi:hypothetical protein
MNMDRVRSRFTAAPTLLALTAACALGCGAAYAQDSKSAPAAIPSPEQLEPAVDTTPGTPAKPADTRPADTAPTANAAAAPANTKGAPAKPGAKKGPDRLELDTSDVRGNRELPKVMYIVPWKKSDLGDLVGRPANSLLDEVLQPLDRDVFQRQNRYYDALKPGEAPPRTDAVQGSGDKP